MDNEIIVLMVCQVCAGRRASLKGRAHSAREGKSRGRRDGMLAFYVIAQILVALVAGSVIFPEPWM